VRLTQRRSFTLDDAYPCPICRCGQVATLPLMEAFACNFCRHIFTANLREQSLRVEDSSQPMTWRWNGRNWRTVNHVDREVSLLLWAIGSILVILPPVLIGFAAYLFPPLPDSAGSWVPHAWMNLTFGLHFLMVAWLLLEHYQVPLYVSGKIQVQDWLSRR